MIQDVELPCKRHLRLGGHLLELAEGGVVVEGTMLRAGWFKSDRLMVSHNNEYRAPKAGHPVDRKELERLMKSTEGLKD